MRGMRVTKENTPVISDHLQKTVFGKTLFLFRIQTRSLKRANQALHKMRSGIEVTSPTVTNKEIHYLPKVYTRKQFEEDFRDDISRNKKSEEIDFNNIVYPFEKGTELLIGRFTTVMIKNNDKVNIKPHGVFIERPSEKENQKSPKQILVIYW